MRRSLAFAPAFVWALLILWLGSLPSLTTPLALPLDKVGHFGMFAVLGALLALGLHGARIRASIAWPLLAGIGVGVIDELHQRTVPGRTAEWADLVADVSGCALALWLAHLALERRESRRSSAAHEDDARPSDPIQEHRA
ncbi:MAG TPA: VanZ family protein [Longimicrobiales bacterium]|nr:VanZ family protein [Longimicrobiales bacterium]